MVYAESFQRLLLLFMSIAAVACSSSKNDGQGAPKDGGAAGSHVGSGGAQGAAGVSGAGGSSGGVGGAGAGGLPIGDIRCGDNVCAPFADTSTASSACCTATGACGLRLSISTTCFSINMPGHTNPVCTSYSIGNIPFSGCCSPTGCGARITIAGIGCAANPNFGRDAVPCVFDTIGAGAPDAH